MATATSIPINAAVAVVSGPPTDATFNYTNPTSGQPGGGVTDGTLAYDSVNGVAYVRAKGAWQPIRPTYQPDPFASPTGITYESFNRLQPPGALSDNASALTSGTLLLVGAVLPAGLVVNKVQFLAGATAEATGTHAWTLMANSALSVLGVSADNTGAAAVGASALFGAAFSAPVTVPTTGLYYFGFNVTATTVPSLINAANLAALTGLAPKLVGTSNTGGTTPPALAATLTAITATANVPYFQLS